MLLKGSTVGMSCWRLASKTTCLHCPVPQRRRREKPFALLSTTGPDAAVGTGGAYNLDKLFRGGAPGTTSTAGEPESRGSDSRMEAMHIAVSAVSSGNISHEDRTYLVSLVASKVGIPIDEPRKRVDAFVQSVQDATVKAVLLARSSAPA
jgi:hypothetical protein